MNMAKLLQRPLFSYIQKTTLVVMAFVIATSSIPPQAVAALTGEAKAPDTSKLAPLSTTDKSGAAAADAGKLSTSGGLSAADTNILPNKPRIRLQEDESKRTALSNEYVNSDGTRTVDYSLGVPKNYFDGAKWQHITPSFKKVQDDNYRRDPFAFPNLMLGGKKIEDASAFDITSGRVSGKLKTYQQGVEIQIGGKTLQFKPRGAANVAPELVTDGEQQYVQYEEAWPGVDVRYILEGEGVKEEIIIRHQNTASTFTFDVAGASLVPHPTEAGALAIEGLDPAQYMVTPVSVSIMGEGGLDGKVAKQSTTGSTITVEIDTDWLRALPSKNFPVVVDPTVTTNYSNGNYISFKSDGYVCYPNGGCGNSTGNTTVGQKWRTALNIPYGFLQGKVLLQASMGLAMPNPDGVHYYGTWDPRVVLVDHASCIGYNCVDPSMGTKTAVIDSSGWIDVTSLYQNFMNANDYGAWIMMRGQEENPSYHSYKWFHPDVTQIQFVYTTAPPMATPAQPADGQVFMTTQPTLKANPVADADGDAVQYAFFLTSNADGTGVLLQSGWQNLPEWTVPDGILQDGATYYWRVAVTDGNTITHPNWSRSLKIDARTGKDPTQAYDSVGGLDVNMATGNLVASNGSNSIAALGGSVGVGLDYNSPQRSRPGLVGEYWNVPANFVAGSPTWAPDMTRVDPMIDFNYGQNSPGGPINNDHFAVRWSGYFVAPTTGQYYFGANNDDGFAIYVDNVLVHYAGICGGICYTNAVSLQAGQAIPLRIEYVEQTSAAYAKLFVKGAVGEQFIPTEWLQTGVRPAGMQHGLVGRYYYDGGNQQIPSDQSQAFMVRTDPLVSFDWSTGSAVPGGPTDSFDVRWSGYFIAPTTGTYEFGTTSDDGVRIKVNNQTTLDYWACCSGNRYGSGVSLNAGQIVPIVVEYYEATGPAYVRLQVRGAVPEQIVPAAWLAPQVPSLPAGWQLTADADGNLTYDNLTISGSSAILTDATGQTHTYTASGGGYKPPVGEDGSLVRNADGTYTLQDADGRTYVFNIDGTLQSVVTPLDDRKPAALKYEYSGTPSRLTKVIDGVTPSRTATLKYSGDGACSGAPGGFDATAPAGMLCAVQTTDGNATKFWYKSGLLSRVERPGGDVTDYGYDTLGRITSVRGSLAADAIAAGQRADDDTAKTQLTYDNIGRVASITQPAATAGATRIVHTYQYLINATNKHISGAAEPNGFSQRIEYDGTYRTIKSVDAANLAITSQWDTVKDMVLSTTDPTGLKSTTLYDDDDRAVQSYGPAPSVWFAADRTPLAAYAAQVPHAETKYDENIWGPAISYYNYRNNPEPGSPNGGSLVSAPALHKTGINANPAVVDAAWPNSNAPFTSAPDANGWGFSATGKVRLTPGTYEIAVHHTEGARLWINDQLVTNDWVDGSFHSSPVHFLTVAAGQAPLRIRLDHYTKFGTPNPTLRLYIQKQGGFGWTTDWSNYLSPGYNLSTSSTTYDSTIGNLETKTNYGASPELGLPQSTTVDPTGLNYINASTYETLGSGYLRQTSRALPGGTTTGYAYYSDTDTADNPCTAQADAVTQAGQLKTKTEADPDGAGPQTSRTSTIIYDATGRPVASRYNSDAWTCTTYDTRGRVTQTIQPVVNGRVGRTVTTTFNYLGSPFKTQVTDTITGSAVSEVDLLGRQTTSTDTFGNTYPITYDALGRVATQTSPLGTESYDYDNLNRNTAYKLDNVIYATITYDAYSRIQNIVYPQAKDASNNTLKLEQIKRDSLLRTSGAVFRFSNNAAFDETLVKTTSGLVSSQTDLYGPNSVTNTYGYDKAGRLTQAIVDKNKYTYGYAAPSAATCNQSAANLNAHKNSNRTSFTVTNTANNQVTSQATYCYNKADQLLTSTDTQLGTPTYDDHGNTTTLAGAGTPIQFTYDASDANTAVTQGANKVEYTKTASGTVLRKKEYANNTLTKSYRYLAGSTVLQTCSLTDDNSCTTTDKYLSLPGGVLLTLSPTNPIPAQQTVYSIKNFHGDTAMTASATGTPTSSVFLYEPFGQPSTSVTFATNSNPANATNAPIGWAASPTRKQETLFSLPIIQMGARVYLPSLGRFAQVDPVEGGTLNGYVYAADPVNTNDYSGQFVVALPGWLMGLSAIPGVGTVVAGGTFVLGIGMAYSKSVGDNARARENSKNKTNGYRPTTRPGGVAIRLETFRTEAALRGMVYVQGQLALGIKPNSRSSGNPILGPPGSGAKGPLNNETQFKLSMSKYAYNYFDIPSGQTIEIHYTIDELHRQYEDLKAK